jgi:hypothetical protein
MPHRERLYGDWLSNLNMTTCGENDVLMWLLGLTGLGCGKILGGDGRNSLDLLDLRWVMFLRSDFGMIHGRVQTLEASFLEF